MTIRIKKINNLVSINGIDDIFICCVSFEDRCKRSTEIIDDFYKAKHGVIFWYNEPEFSDTRFKNKREIEKNLEKAIENDLIVIAAPLKDAVEGVEKFKKCLQERSIKLKNKKITIDLTVFTKQYLMTLLDYLDDPHNENKLRIVYTFVDTYGIISKGLPLSKGLDDIIAVSGFGGRYSHKKKNLLIMFLGFEGKRALAVYEKYAPHFTIAIIGKPAYEDEWTEYSEKLNQALLEQYNVEKEYASVMDPFGVCTLLENIYKKYKNDYNIYIAPLGTKLQTLGAYLFSKNYPAVQFVYPIPSDYPQKDFSEGVGETWELLLRKDNNTKVS